MTESTESTRPVPPDQQPGDPELEDERDETTSAKDADAEAEEARVDAAPREVP